MSLVGVGAMGQRHVRVLRGLESRFELAGAFDLRHDAAVPAELRRLRDEGQAIGEADVVIVATPIESHGAIVARALAAGRHVLVEKPLCATSAEAHALTGHARAGGRLFVGHSERFNPVVRALARLVREDPAVSLTFRRVGPCRPSGYGVLVNLGVHDLDLAAYLGGGELSLRGAVGASLSIDRGQDGAEDVAHVLFATAGGAIGHVYVDRTVPSKQRSITLTTDRWVYQGDLLSHRLTRTPRPGHAPSSISAGPTDVPLPLEEPLVAQATALADALDGSTSREIATGLDGSRAVTLAEQAAGFMSVLTAVPSSGVTRAPG